MDFCRLESMYVDWERWMAGAFACNRDFSLCRFLDLLFFTYYECLPECVDCLPCKDPGEPAKPGCWDDDKYSRVPVIRFIDQVNELFCFADYCSNNTDRLREAPMKTKLVLADLPRKAPGKAPAKPAEKEEKKPRNKKDK